MTKIKPRTWDMVAMAFLFALGLVVALPRLRSGMDMMDEGFLACGADRVLQGQIPNRDFVSLQPPGSFYVAAMAFKLLGVSLVSLRVLGLAIYLTLIGLIYAITRLMTGSPLALAASIPAIFLGLADFDFVPFAVWQGIAASTWAVLFFLWAAKKGSRMLAMMAGLWTGASLLLRQDQAFYAAISMLIFACILRKGGIKSAAGTGPGRLVLFWMLGIVLIVVPAGIYWSCQGAVPQIFQQLVVNPLTRYAKTSSLPFPNFNRDGKLGDYAFVALFYLVPVAILAIGAWLVRRIWRHGINMNEARLAFVTVWAGLFYGQALTRTDSAHFLITLVPFFILCACFWQSIGAPRIASVIVGCAVGAFLFLASNAVFPRHSGEEYLDLDRGGVRVKNGAAITQVVRQIRSSVPANRSILCLPYAPMFYFLCERRNPTRWNYLWPGDQTVEDHKEFVREAMGDPPACVLLLGGREKLSANAPVVFNYIEMNFKQTANYGDLIVYTPNH